MNALWLFLIAIVSTLIVTVQNGFFAQAAAQLTRKLRSLSFRAILRQDSTSYLLPLHGPAADGALS